MRVIGKRILLKLKKKNLGNNKLGREIDKLIEDLEGFKPEGKRIGEIRNDADCVYGEEFYFFNISVHRTLILIEYDDEGEVTIVWAGTHQEYEREFKNNKSTIEKWLRSKGYIE